MRRPNDRDALSRRGLILVAGDAAAAACALQAAYLLRFEGAVPAAFVHGREVALPVLVIVQAAATLRAGLHRWSFTLAGMPEALRLLAAQLVASGAFFVLTLTLPKSIYALQLFFSIALIGALRFGPGVVRSWQLERSRVRAGARRTIIVGAGEAGELLARDVRRNERSTYFLVGFVDDDRAKVGTRLLGRPVLGRLDELPGLVSEHDIEVVLIAIARLLPARLRQLLDLCSALKVKFKIIPPSFSEIEERIAATLLHDVSPQDLLPRDAVAFDQEEIRRLVRGRRTLVTGAGGSIGGEIVRQLACLGASAIVLVDMNENELYLSARRLARDHPAVAVHAEVADVREPLRLRQLGERYRPAYVFHAAAHKHVPLMEDAPAEAIKNNVFGTLHAARMAIACGAERFVLISTDKAVNPTSIMGASKRIAELVVRDLARRSATHMTAVRFGNVLGSAGSVIPLFKQQIEGGGPVTVTHPECTRYFMTIPESVGLVLLAGLRCPGELCVLDMGEPIRILELARNLITLAGRVPGDEIPIVFTGLRPGEKLREELLTDDEERALELRDRIQVAHGTAAPPARLWRRLAELRRATEAGDTAAVLAIVRELVPTYRSTLLLAEGSPAARPVAAWSRERRLREATFEDGEEIA